MTDFVRVKVENGSEVTLDRGFAEAKKLEILDDKPAVDQRGYALNAKHKANLAPSGSKYAGMKPEDLQAMVDERQLSVEGSGKDGNVLKADLVAALDAHDVATGADAT